MPQSLPDSGFHHTASYYDWLAYLVFGSSLKRSQLSLLPFLPHSGKLLIIGGGSGWILEQVLITGKNLDILYLDAAPAMLAKAKHRFDRFGDSHNCRVIFKLGTEADLTQGDNFQVILTPFLLDLFPPPRLHKLMATLDAALVKGGHWLLADFWPVQARPPLWQRTLIRLMYFFFGKVADVQARQLPEYNKYFHNLGYTEIFSDSFYGKLVQAKAYIKP